MSEAHEEVLEVPYDSGDPKAVAKRAATARRREASNRTVIRQVMGSNLGRAWVYEILSMCGVYTSTFSTNALTMAHNEGQRNVGLRLTAAVVAACPERYMEMLKEASDE